MLGCTLEGVKLLCYDIASPYRKQNKEGVMCTQKAQPGPAFLVGVLTCNKR